MKLNLKILLGTSILLIFVFGLTGFIIFTTEKTMLIEHDILDRVISSCIYDVMVSANASGSRDFHNDLKKIGNMDHVELFRGDAIVRQFGPSKKKQDKNELVDASFETGRNYQRVGGGDDGTVLIQTFHALKAERKCLQCHIAEPGEVLGVFATKYSKDAKSMALRKRHIGLFAMTFFSIFLVIACLFVLIRYMVLDKLKVLVSATEAVGKGDLDTRVVIKSGDEIQRLGDSFNEMTARLKDIQGSMVQAEKQAAIGRLASGITHEVNNPTGIIISRIECIQDDLKSAGEIDRKRLLADLDVMKKHAARISRITQGLLAFSRKTSSEYRMVDMSALIDKTHLLLDKELSAKNIAFNKSPNKPNRPFYAWGNENELQQVLFNILDNARDSMAGGGKIRVALSETGGSENGGARKYVRVEISDTGEGISGENIKKIFEPYFSTKETGKGTGLGLAICYKIVSDHGGKIEVDSEEGKGATFRISLPVSRQTK